MTQCIRVLAAFLTVFLYLTGAVHGAQAADALISAPFSEDLGKPRPTPALRLDTPSGLPVPRLVSLKTDKTYCRSGPTFNHPVRVTFMRAGLPVMIVAETRDHWRKIRDPEGDECWTHKSKLSGAETALVLEDGLILRAKPNGVAPVRARLGRGVIARVETSRDGWLRVSADGRTGWARSSAFWGARAAAPIAAPHN